MSSTRQADVRRETAETRLALSLTLDGDGRADVRTGLPFFDHMLTLFARHGLFNLAVEAAGDLEVDAHHTVEDTGIVLGQAFARAVGDKTGLVRYGNFLLPMDETLARVAVDLSGRPLLVYRLPADIQVQTTLLQSGRGFPFQLVEEFLRAFATHGGATLHAEILYGRDPHHLAEALFKALARALDVATRIDPRAPESVPSTKGTLV